MIAHIVRMSPLMTEITLDFQTMMCCMSGGCLETQKAGLQGAFHAMVTKIQAIVTMGGVTQVDRLTSRSRITYSEGGTHEETLHPQSKAKVMNKRQRD